MKANILHIATKTPRHQESLRKPLCTLETLSLSGRLFLKIFLYFSLFTFHFSLLAQQKNIDTIQFNVITKYKPVINDAAKLNSNPAIADTTKVVKNVQYNFLNSQVPTSFTPQSINAVQLKPEPLDALYHSLLSAGAGNYNTLYGEYFFNCKRSDGADYGIHLNHLSSDATLHNSANSSYSFNDVNLYGKETFGQHSLYAEADYDEHVVHDYGYNPSDYPFLPDTREQYNLFGGLVKYKSEYKDSSKINHEVKVGYDNFSNLYNLSENQLDADFKLFTYLGRQRFDLNGTAEYYNDPYYYSGGPPIQSYVNSWNLSLNPFFTMTERQWDAHIGVNAYYANVSGGTNVYPDVLLRLHIAQDVVMIYGGVDGNQTFNSFQSLSDQNPYLTNPYFIHLPNMQFTFVQYHAFGGITGSITSQLTYNASVAQSQINNMPLFASFASEPNTFYVLYDNVKELNVHGDLEYKLRSDFSLALGGDYFSYTPATQLEAWYHPALKLSLDGKYSINEKYAVRAEFFYIGSQYAPMLENYVMTAKTLSAYPDLNLGFDYKYSKAFSAFLNLNNLANVTYYQWDNYPMQRFNLMVGVRLGF